MTGYSGPKWHLCDLHKSKSMNELVGAKGLRDFGYQKIPTRSIGPDHGV